MATPIVSPLPAEGSGFRDPSYSPESERTAFLSRPSDPWEKEVLREGFAEDLEKNLEDLASGISVNRLVDAEFLTIFQKDIDMLARAYVRNHLALDSKECVELRRMNIRLQELAAMMQKVVNDNLSRIRGKGSVQQSVQEASNFWSDNVVPLVGPFERPVTLASDNETPIIKKGLQTLDEGGYRVRRVRGNGHCLFSSIAALLLNDEHLSSIKRQLPGMKREGLLGSFDGERLINTCHERLQAGVSVEQLLQDEKIYYDWIKFLRLISVNWWKKNIQESVETRAELANAAREAMPVLRTKKDDQEVCDTYLKRMESLEAEEPRYGGFPEIHALENIFGIPIHTIYVKDVGEAALKNRTQTILPQIADLSHMWLLYRSSHFDPLYLPEQVPSAHKEG